MLGINKLLAFLRRQVGLRTDAASATGSLHAKTTRANNEIDATKTTIGTSAHTRANDTVMGWLATQVKSVQRGTVSLSGASTDTGVTISTVNTAKAVLIFNSRTAWTGAYSEVPDVGHILSNFATGVLTNATTLTFSHNSTTSWPNTIVTWQVIEFY